MVPRQDRLQFALPRDMSNKRRNSSSPECDTPAKRQRQQSAESISSYNGTQDDDFDESETEERPQVHAYTGQAGAFPGLKQNDDQPFYGPAADGIDYLRMVRSEAKGIPGLLIAENVEIKRIEQGPEEEDGGYWEEDAYIAAPRAQQSKPGSGLPDAQSRYYEVLLAHYRLVRATMRCVPPLSAIEKLTSSQPISFPSESKKARYTWEQCLRTKNPNPTQIACMDENSIFELARLLTKKMRGLFEKDDIELVRRLGAWTWAILGKFPERGELASDEISILRELARRAVDVREWLTRKNKRVGVPSADEDEDEEDEDEDVEDEENILQETVDTNGGREINSDIQAARERITVSTSLVQSNHEMIDGQKKVDGPDGLIDNQDPRQARLAIMDMILTVVSEAYGQRDLQEYRTIWEQDPS